MSKYIAKVMYLKIPELLIIWNRRRLVVLSISTLANLVFLDATTRL